MNKSELRQVQQLAVAHKLGMADMVARSLSALIRASMTKRSRQALIAQAILWDVVQHPEFII
jgi:hypothetical protein